MTDKATFRPGGRTPVARAVLGMGAVALMAAACSGGHKKAAPTTTTSSTTSTTVAPTTTTVPPTYPLTGLPATNRKQMQSPAVVIKIDNVTAARPQTGLNQADVVYDAMVEGGLSRLAAIYQSQYPPSVGPVRSGRLTDEGVADDLNHPVLVFAGTNAIFMPILASQPLTLVTADTNPNLFIRVGNNAPHNLFANVASLAAQSRTHTAPAPLFTYVAAGQQFGGAGATPASAVSYSFPAASVQWNYDAATGVYLRTQDGTPDMLADGHQVTAKNVILYFINYANSGTASGEGVPNAEIPEGILTGKGNVWVLSGGKLVKGTFDRPNLTTVATYKDATGAPIALQPGNTWVELPVFGTVPSVTP